MGTQAAHTIPHSLRGVQFRIPGGLNVFEASILRTKHYMQSLFERGLKPVVSSSGGKDSMAILETSLIAWKELGKNEPLDVFHFDKEVHAPTTLEYLHRLCKRPELKMHWYCLPVKGSNPFNWADEAWTSWDPSKKEIWVNELPDCAITSSPSQLDTESHNFYRQWEKDNDCRFLTGIRVSESMVRRQILIKRGIKKTSLADWLDDSVRTDGDGCHPIYDWTDSDVWLAAKKFKWDYNTIYDLMYREQVPTQHRRLATPLREEGFMNLRLWSKEFPAMWKRMTKRFAGLENMHKQIDSELYGRRTGREKGVISYERAFHKLMSGPHSGKMSEKVIQLWLRHTTRTFRGLTEDTPDPVSSVCWRLLWQQIQSASVHGGNVARGYDEINPGLLQMLKLPVGDWNVQKPYLRDPANEAEITYIFNKFLKVIGKPQIEPFGWWWNPA